MLPASVSSRATRRTECSLPRSSSIGTRLVVKLTKSIVDLTPEPHPEASLGSGEARGDCRFRNAESERDLSVGVAVKVTKHDHSRLLWRQRPEFAPEFWMQALGRIRILGSSQAQDQLPDLTQLLPPPLRERHVQGNPVHPGLSGRILLPLGPGSEGAQERVLCGVLGARPILQDDDQGREDALIGLPVEHVEVVLVSGTVVRPEASSIRLQPQRSSGYRRGGFMLVLFCGWSGRHGTRAPGSVASKISLQDRSRRLMCRARPPRG